MAKGSFAPDVTIKLEGVQQLLKNLEQFSQTIQRRIVRKAVSAGSTPMLQAVKAAAPRETGLLKKSIGRKVKTYRNSGVVLVIIGPRSGFRTVIDDKPRNPLMYAHLVEFGTSKAPAKPFMRPAFQAMKQTAQNIIRQKLAEEIEKEAKKLKKTGKK